MTTASPKDMLSNNPITITALAVAVGLLVFRIFRSLKPISITYQRYSVDHDTAKNGKTSQIAKIFPNIAEAVQKAYSTSRQVAFVVTGKRPWVTTDMVIIPPKWIDDLKNLPEDKLSFVDAVNDRLNLPLTYKKPPTESRSHAVIRSVTVDLTRQLSKVMTDLDDEVNFAINKYMPDCNSWEEVYIGAILPQVISQVSGRIFVGLPLCRDEEFIKSTVTFTIDTFIAGDQLNNYPAFARKFIAPWLKVIRTCYQQHNKMQTMLKSQLEERLVMVEQGETLPSDMMTWLIHNSEDNDKFDLYHQAQAQLGISMAAIHTTNMTVSNALLDLAARPEYVQPLRDEWEDVLSTEDSHAISKSSMPKLRKLDSFLKESQRLTPLGPTTFDRRVRKDLKLPDGTVLPKGAYLAAPTQAINMDNEIWENPETFDGFRFAKLREQPGAENRYQFATTGVDSMNFGHGKHACPGRFFAANEIKLILAYFLQNYEMKLKDGQSRPESIYTPTGMRPNYEIPILMKRRST